MMNLDWMEFAWAKLGLIKDTFEVLPDIDDESQRECMIDTVKTLRELADVIERNGGR